MLVGVGLIQHTAELCIKVLTKHMLCCGSFSVATAEGVNYCSEIQRLLIFQGKSIPE